MTGQDLKMTKIWIGKENPELGEKVFNKLKSMGIDPRNIWGSYKRKEGFPWSFYIDDTLYLTWNSDDTEESFKNHQYDGVLPDKVLENPIINNYEIF